MAKTPKNKASEHRVAETEPVIKGENGWDEYRIWMVETIRGNTKTLERLENVLGERCAERESRLAVLEERVSAETVEGMKKGIQGNSLSLAKIAGAGTAGATIVFVVEKFLAYLAQMQVPPVGA